MLNKLGKIALAVALFGSGIGIGTVVVSQANGSVTINTPGSANDPVVTKSYVDEAIRKLAENGIGGGGSGTVTELKIVSLKDGERLVVTSGTEVILRSGKAEIFSDSVEGASDLTDGEDLRPGKTAPRNHLLLFPRDNRGIKAQGSAIALVRGSYSILPAE
jgi:hypothetical protein